MEKSFQKKLDSELKRKLADKEANCQSLLDKWQTWRNATRRWSCSLLSEQLEAFDAERQAQELQKEAAEGETRELGLHYAEILGHQNHKQKIRHVIKLREQIHELKKENERLEIQL